MYERVILVKLFDLNKTYIGKGSLLSLSNNAILVKGNKLPILNYGAIIFIEVYDEISGVSPYLCKVSVASDKQLNAQILRKDPIIERRTALKVRTNLSIPVSLILRNGEDITNEMPNAKISILNLSIGGMLISSNIKFLLNDVFTFCFKYYKNKPLILEAKIMRIDELECEDGEIKVNLSYGCNFLNMANSDESIILQYLFDRQLQLYRNK